MNEAGSDGKDQQHEDEVESEAVRAARLAEARSSDPWHRKPEPPPDSDSIQSRLLEPWTPPPPRVPRPQVPASGLEGPVDAGPLHERLIRATLESLRRNGFEATTSREIAQIADTYLQAITYHFGSKDELVAEALVRTIQTWISPARTILRSKNEDPAARMIAAVQALQVAFTRAKPLMPVYVEALLQTRTNDLIRARVRHILRDLRKLLVHQMSELREAGFLPSWLEPEPMATLLLSTADGLVIHTTIDPKSVDHEAVGRQVMQLLLSAREPSQPIPPSPRGRRRPGRATRTR